MVDVGYKQFTLSRNAFGHLSLESEEGSFVDVVPIRAFPISDRSEEHTSELQSH